jgi:hypothetical protein
MRRGNPFFRSDVVLLCSASYGINSGSPIEGNWPLDQYTDMSAIHCATNYTGQFMPDDNWSTIRKWVGGYGGYMYGIVWEMRCRGLNPAICHISMPGTMSSVWLANANTFAIRMQDRVNSGQITEPRIGWIVVDSGTGDASSESDHSSFLSNWTTVLSTIRSTVTGSLNAKLVVLETPKNAYAPGGNSGQPYEAEVNAQKATLVANEIAAGRYAAIARMGNPVYVDQWHPDYASDVLISRNIVSAMMG